MEDEELIDTSLCECGEYLKGNGIDTCYRCEKRDFGSNQKPVKKTKKPLKKKV
jgi:hypothetical protein